MRVVMAKAATDRLDVVDPTSAAQWSVQLLRDRVEGLGGIILLNRQGQVGFAYNTPRMAFAYMQEGMDSAILGI
jgi:beta-aspartyl-peptidase (threonine type)